MLVCEKGYTETVKLLLSKKPSASINVRNKKGETALKIASKKGFTEIIKILKNKGAIE